MTTFTIRRKDKLHSTNKPSAISRTKVGVPAPIIVSQDRIIPSNDTSPSPKAYLSKRPVRGKGKNKLLGSLLGTWLLLIYFSVIVSYGIIESGTLDKIRKEHGNLIDIAARQMRFGLDQINISGLKQLRISEVLLAAEISPKGSLPTLDVAEAKNRLERLPLIKSASLRKLYPNKVVITLVEREPYAIWQNNGELYVISKDGTIIDLMQDVRFLNLPFVAGEYANKNTQSYINILESSGSLRKRIIAGSMIGGRRWNLKMDNGIQIQLPELGAGETLKRFALLEEKQKILEKDILIVDLRLPDRIVIRLSEEAAAARNEALKNKKIKGRGVRT